VTLPNKSRSFDCAPATRKESGRKFFAGAPLRVCFLVFVILSDEVAAATEESKDPYRRKKS
jgi:hypothetical protein